MHSRLAANILRMPSRLKKGQWPNDLPQPIHAMDTTLIYRADSYLRGFVKDSTGLTVKEAADVVSWSEQSETIKRGLPKDFP